MVNHYILISVPYLNAADPQPMAQFLHLQQQMGSLGGALRQFTVPTLKFGTLDSLLEASDELAKVDTFLEGVIQKLASLLEEVTGKNREAVCTIRINPTQELSTDAYLKHFGWNAAQFDVKEPLTSLIERLRTYGTQADERARTLLTEYNECKTKLMNFKRASEGSLALRNIAPLVQQWQAREKEEILDTEFLQTVFVAVPRNVQKEFMSSYWQIHDFICPRSASLVAEESDFSLYAVVLFKRAHDDFVQGCRKMKCTVREYNPSHGADPAEMKDLEHDLEQKKKHMCTLLGHQFSVCFVSWVHTKAIRIFVESLLKYGLPPQFVSVLIAADATREAEIRRRISQIHTDLGNPLARDRDDLPGDGGALQHEYPYVSLKVTNIAHR